MTNNSIRELKKDDLLKVLNKILDNFINIKIIKFEQDRWNYTYTFILKDKPEYKLIIMYYYNRNCEYSMRFELGLYLPNGNVYFSDDYPESGKSEISELFNKVYELIKESYKNEDKFLFYNFLK